MAILCGTLGWLEHQKLLKREEARRIVRSREEHQPPTSIPFITTVEAEQASSHQDKTPPSPNTVDFTPRSILSSVKASTTTTTTTTMTTEQEERAINEELNRMPKAPKILITSRTHKQIAQLVGEMARTSYRPSFVVLGSRKHYCINQKVLAEVKREKKDLNEACKDLNRSKTSSLSGPEGHLPCRYFRQIQEQTKGGRSYPPPNKDIEDFVEEGEDNAFCPYFGAMASIPECEVIFAPYNYIIDPSIWKSMKLDGVGECVVIVDEAHNIEDVCRDSASFEITDEQLAGVQRELFSLIPDLRKPGSGVDEGVIKAHESQGHILAIINNWLRNSAEHRNGSQRKDFDTTTMIWNGKEIPEELDSIGLRPSTISALLLDLDKVTQHTENVLKGEKGFKGLNVAIGGLSGVDAGGVDDDGVDDRDFTINVLKNNNNNSNSSTTAKKPFNISYGSLQLLERLLDSLNSLFRNDKKDISSFSLVKFESITKAAGMMSSKKALISLGFWCWNPAIMFSKLTEKSRSVILTSGTLSPMDTFSSELECVFDNRLEALHIIDDHQVLITCLPRGPSNTALIGNFRTMDSLAFQDDIANGLRDVCAIVPGGVVCFVPSYSFMEKLKRRMVVIGVMGEIETMKSVFTEPRMGSPKEFESFLSGYYKAIPSSGALLFAVYRGKISEGLDLKDDNCRAVVPIGIPYPAFKDPKVVLKREYNDRRGNNHLTGQQWYESQAFRALNQALGRCIRHRKDWGAVLLLEQRFTSPRNSQHLSKWVRGRLSACNDNNKQWKDGMAELKNFVSRNQTTRSSATGKDGDFGKCYNNVGCSGGGGGGDDDSKTNNIKKNITNSDNTTVVDSDKKYEDDDCCIDISQEEYSQETF